MNKVEKVIWSHAGLVDAHHFQRQDRYHEALVAARLSALSPFGWGAVKIQIDRQALASGQLAIERFVGVLPDGLYVDISGESAEQPPSRPLAEHFSTSLTTLDVYLGVARERDGTANCSHEREPGVRYRLAHREVSDLSNNASSTNVPFGHPNLVVLFGSEPRHDHDGIKIAEVTRDSLGAFVLVDTYIPPCLQINASEHLQQSLKALVPVLRGRRKALSEARRERDNSTVGFDAADVTRFLLLNTINRHLPVIEHWGHSPDVAPREVYVRLVELAGELTTFSTSTADFAPKFHFTDLRLSFGDLFKRVVEMLQSSVREHYIPVELQARNDGMHLATLDDARFGRCDRFVLAVRADIKRDVLVKQLPIYAKLASYQDIDGVVRSATPGALLTSTFQPPAEIPVKAGEAYFVIDTANTYWRNILAERAIAVFLPQPFDPKKTRVQLLAIPPRSKEAVNDGHAMTMDPS